MVNEESYLTRKLRYGARLDDADVDSLEQLIAKSQTTAISEDLIVEGARPHYVHIMASGTACRYKLLPDGRRAILALLLPGDFCDLHVSILGHMDHSIGALTECEVTRVSPEMIDALLDGSPNIYRACRWATLVDEAILREWIVNIGRRSSEQQLAHLFCELYVRLTAVGLTDDYAFRMPFTQGTLGDLLGISEVHVQRTMRQLREANLITLQDRHIHLSDFDSLADLGEFEPDYLHLSRTMS